MWTQSCTVVGFGTGRGVRDRMIHWRWMCFLTYSASAVWWRPLWQQLILHLEMVFLVLCDVSQYWVNVCSALQQLNWQVRDKQLCLLVTSTVMLGSGRFWKRWWQSTTVYRPWFSERCEHRTWLHVHCSIWWSVIPSNSNFSFSLCIGKIPCFLTCSLPPHLSGSEVTGVEHQDTFSNAWSESGTKLISKIIISKWTLPRSWMHHSHPLLNDFKAAACARGTSINFSWFSMGFVGLRTWQLQHLWCGSCDGI